MTTANILNFARQFAEDARRILQDNVLEEYAFSSHPKSPLKPEPDINILIIVQSSSTEVENRIRELASDYTHNHDVLISPMVWDAESWDLNKMYNSQFYQAIKGRGIRL